MEIRKIQTGLTLGMLILPACGGGLNRSALNLSDLIKNPGSISPTVTLDSFPSQINAANVSLIPLAGTCAVENGAIQVSAGTVSGSTVCSQGTWALNLDFTSLAEGSITIAAVHTNSSSGATLSTSTTVVKDTLPPTGVSLVINNGWINTLSTSATLMLSATGASEMYITAISGCTSGGTWEAFLNSKPWTLTSLNADNTLYVKYRDAAGNESACVLSNIHHGTGTSYSDAFTGSALSSYWQNKTLQSVSGGEVIFTPTPNTTVAAQSSVRLDFTDATVSVEVTQVLNTSASTQTFLYMMDESFNALYIYVSNSNIYFVRELAYNATTIPYNAVTHRFWRIRFASPNIFWET
ncbi:MAG: hypothetical protein H7333_10155, partial [Bdellovibrionales bacterium]|nr:hypothetical protein [Oligoflexia bacterium]